MVLVGGKAAGADDGDLLTLTEPDPVSPAPLLEAPIADDPGGYAGASPGWYIPALVTIAAIAVVTYAWAPGQAALDTYYMAAVRSMSLNWHNFFYGAFDPAGTISVDKLPEGLWLQALSVKVFGVHNWALVLPQVLEGGLTVIVLARAVRRLIGWRAGLLAAAVLAVSPAAAGLNRGNVPDALMVLCLVLAADSASKAVALRRPGSIMWAGVWVGLAFEAKMAEAWLALPALGLMVLVAGPGTVRKRLGALCVATVVMLVVSFGWMTIVSMMPTGGRPYVDGSTTDSLFQQVFVYNGTSRLGSDSPTAVELGNSPYANINPARWDRLTSWPDDLDVGWLLPAALAIGVFGLLSRRKRRASDPIRAFLILWTSWLVCFTVAFSIGEVMETYYAGAVVPAIAALCGAGMAFIWENRREGRYQLLLLAATAGIVGYALWLMPPKGTGLSASLSSALAVATLAATAIALVIFLLSRPEHPSTARLLGGLATLMCFASALAVPAVATFTVAYDGLGPFDTPFQPTSVTSLTHLESDMPKLLKPALTLLKAVKGNGYLLATDSAIVASPFIDVTGSEVYPLGGATGGSPQPSLSELKKLVAEGKIHTILLGSSFTDPRYKWIKENCVPIPFDRSVTALHSLGSWNLAASIFYCIPSSAIGLPGKH